MEGKKLLLLFLLMLLKQPSITTAASPDVIFDHCPDTCGNVHVPYPFGINFTSGINNDPSCSLNNFFMFTCNTTSNPPQLYFGDNMPIYNISVEEGTISVRIDAAFNCYNQSGLAQSFSQSIGLGGGPFRFSDTLNKLTTIGCDTLALMQDAQETFGGGCISMCSRNMVLQGSCSGFGCCQTPIPRNVTTLNINLGSISNHTEVLNFNPCEFAFLADERTFNVSDWQLSLRPFSSETRQFVTSDVVIEWVARQETCEESQSSLSPNRYVCGENTNCSYSDNVMGYRCSCKDGFVGNPYLPQGCQGNQF